ncbi:MAG: hypothetical protein ACFCGT_00600 [Sandaracinaceae bacterium]
MKRIVRTPIGVLALALAACGGSSSPAEEEPTAGAEDTDIQGVRVELVNEGEEPRVPLRYVQRNGMSDRVRLEFQLYEQVTMGGENDLFEGPPARFIATLGPTEVESGLLEVPVAITAAELFVPSDTSDEAVAFLEARLTPLTQIQGSYYVDAMGRTRARALLLPDAELPSRITSILTGTRTLLMTVPLPEEPVGVGAEWEAVRILDGVVEGIEQRTRYTVSSMTEGGAVLRVSVRESAREQQLIEQVDDHGQVEARLTNFDSTGQGTVTIRFDALSAAGRVEVTNISQVELTIDGETETMRSEIRLAARVQPESAEADATIVEPTSEDAPAEEEE